MHKLRRRGPDGGLVFNEWYQRPGRADNRVEHRVARQSQQDCAARDGQQSFDVFEGSGVADRVLRKGRPHSNWAG